MTPGKFGQKEFEAWWGSKPSIHARMGFDEGYRVGYTTALEDAAKLFEISEGGRPAYPNAYSNMIRALKTAKSEAGR
jgi:phage head maturation protease